MSIKINYPPNESANPTLSMVGNGGLRQRKPKQHRKQTKLTAIRLSTHAITPYNTMAYTKEGRQRIYCKPFARGATEQAEQHSKKNPHTTQGMNQKSTCPLQAKLAAQHFDHKKLPLNPKSIGFC